ncbi:MAG: hypothetical protein NVSMB64_20100 [Candidatus Velthaea sp.]
MTPDGTTFPVPMTINVYAVDNTTVSHVGALLTTQTATFNVPYRPSYDSVRCAGLKVRRAVTATTKVTLLTV